MDKVREYQHIRQVLERHFDGVVFIKSIEGGSFWMVDCGLVYDAIKLYITSESTQYSVKSEFSRDGVKYTECLEEQLADEISSSIFHGKRW